MVPVDLLSVSAKVELVLVSPTEVDATASAVKDAPEKEGDMYCDVMVTSRLLVISDSDAIVRVKVALRELWTVTFSS